MAEISANDIARCMSAKKIKDCKGCQYAVNSCDRPVGCCSTRFYADALAAVEERDDLRAEVCELTGKLSVLALMLDTLQTDFALACRTLNAVAMCPAQYFDMDSVFPECPQNVEKCENVSNVWACWKHVIESWVDSDG